MPDQLHCYQCKYDLRATDPLGSCPECGYPVPESQQLFDASEKDTTLGCLTLFGMFAGYAIINFLAIRSTFIPMMGSLVVWGFIFPSCLAIAGLLHSVKQFYSRRIKIGLGAASIICAALLGLCNIWVITAIWATI